MLNHWVLLAIPEADLARATVRCFIKRKRSGTPGVQLLAEDDFVGKGPVIGIEEIGFDILLRFREGVVLRKVLHIPFTLRDYYVLRFMPTHRHNSYYLPIKCFMTLF